MYTLFGDKMNFERVIPVILSFLILCGCAGKANNDQRQKIDINYTFDNSVNDYRLEDEHKVSAENVTVEEAKTENASEPSDNNKDSEATYCANKNSKKFHLSSCGSVSTMKKENKLMTNDRKELINDGYTPCKTCNP